MRATTCLVPIALGLLGCNRSRATPAANDAAPDASVIESATIDAAMTPSAIGPTSPSSWTDPRVIDAIAANCAWTPPVPKSPHGLGVARTTRHELPTSCSKSFDQACVYDPCNDAETSCSGDCTEKCESCGSTCVAACEACKKPCTDAACRKNCAVTCGACRQECIRNADHCHTADCAKVAKACSAKLVAEWNQSGCRGVCRAAAACHAQCVKDYKEGCDQACVDRFKGACPEKLLGYCTYDPPNYNGPLDGIVRPLGVGAATEKD